LTILKDLITSLQHSVGRQASAPTEVERLKAQLRAAEREARKLRAIVALDQAHRGRWDELEATLSAEKIAASMAGAVADAELDEQPMPHLVLRHLWPAATYSALLEAIPPDDCFPDRDPVKQNVKIRHADAVPAWTRRALEFLEDSVIPGILTPAVVARMRPYLEHPALPHHATAGRLMLRRPGYRLAPHLDPQRVAVTCLLYFARPGDNAEYGTQLFAVDRPVVVDRAKTFYPGEHGYTCTLVKTVAFEPNTALVFLNRGGAHAAEIPSKAPKETRRFSYQFYVGPDDRTVEASHS
jgi:hypothetical protein